MLPNRENNGEILWDVVGGRSTDYSTGHRIQGHLFEMKVLNNVYFFIFPMCVCERHMGQNGKNLHPNFVETFSCCSVDRHTNLWNGVALAKKPIDCLCWDNCASILYERSW
jgi:hypothetical protein